jgi:hypothetical protein
MKEVDIICNDLIVGLLILARLTSKYSGGH